MSSKLLRLQKIIAQAGVSSRRAAEELLNPWPKGQSLELLSPTRGKAVQEAAARLVELAKRGKTSRPSPRAGARRPEADLEMINSTLEKSVGISLQQLTYFVLV